MIASQKLNGRLFHRVALPLQAELLGPGGSGSGRPVAVKALSLKGLKGDWKQVGCDEWNASRHLWSSVSRKVATLPVGWDGVWRRGC